MSNTRTPSPTSHGSHSSRTPPPPGSGPAPPNRSPNYRNSSGGSKGSQGDGGVPSLRPNIPSMLPKSAQGSMGMHQPPPSSHRPINAVSPRSFLKYSSSITYLFRVNNLRYHLRLVTKKQHTSIEGVFYRVVATFPRNSFTF